MSFALLLPIAACLLWLTVAPLSSANAAPPTETVAPVVDPTALLFRRQAVQRFVFNNNLPLCKIDPTGAFDLGLMHPATAETTGSKVCQYAVETTHIVASNPDTTPAASSMLVGGVNPYATYDVEVQASDGGGEVGMEWATLDRTTRLAVVAGAKGIVVERATVGAAMTVATVSDTALAAPYTLRVQMFGTKMNVYTVHDGQTHLAGAVDLLPDLNLRKRELFGALKFGVVTRLTPGTRVVLGRVESYLSCGMGQADIRPITYRDGAPLLTDNRLWFTLSLRGSAGGILSAQGVFSLDPSLFDPRLEGVIVYDRGDGQLRNDYASHLYYDEVAHEWRGWTVGFSAQGDGSGAHESILAVRSKHDPRRGFSVMQATPMPLTEKAEDPSGFYDADAGRWRLLVTSFEKGLHAVLYESPNWNGPYTRLAGPVPEDSTGTLIQKIGDRRYILAGSGEKQLYVYSYPKLTKLGTVKMDLPPYDATHNGRVWPNVVPLPAGFPSRYVALMMDRVNFPGITGANWTYGALYFYYADAPFPAMSDWYEFPENSRPQ